MIIDCGFWIMYYWLLTIDYWLLLIDYCLLIIVNWLLIIDYWLLIIDYLNVKHGIWKGEPGDGMQTKHPASHFVHGFRRKVGALIRGKQDRNPIAEMLLGNKTICFTNTII